MASVCSGDVVADKYRVERLLGRGGMGYVVAARHLSLDELFAIKFLRRTAALDGDEDAIARFRREAKACAVLKNDHVARVFDVGIHGDEPFIVMEHLEGNDLGHLTRDGQVIPISAACDYILQACEGLAEAHALGIVHRDIKLPNLFVTKTSSGAPLLKVLDFGVSKTMAGTSAASAFDLGGADVTQTAAVLGSPKYMSPEQMNDPRGVDARTDVWSLGICLYRMLCGVAPFDADTIGQLCTMVLHQQPMPIADLRPDLGIAPHVEAVISVCLQKDPLYRFANVAELAAALAPFANDPLRAAEQTQHIANVLGVPVPPQGFLPSPPLHQLRPMFQTSSSLEGASGWAHNMVAAKRQKQRGELVLALAAGVAALGLLVVGVSVFGGELNNGPRRSMAESPPPPPTAIVVTTPPPTAIVIAPPPSPSTTAAATTTTPPTPPPTPTSTPPKRPKTGPAPTAFPIPGDRK